MPYDKVVDSSVLDANLVLIADACRNVKTKEQYDGLVDMAVGSRKITISLDEILEGCTFIGAKAFMSTGISGDIVIPEGITSIEYEAFMQTAITSVVLPSTLRGLPASDSGYTFCTCQRLKSVTFKSTPSRIESNTFRSCTALADIYVPWSEGAVSGAPWGATSATIHYDSEV